MDLPEFLSRLGDVTAHGKTGVYPEGCDERDIHLFDLRCDDRPLRFTCYATVLSEGIEEGKFNHQLKVDWSFTDFQNLKCLPDLFRLSEYFHLPDTYKVRPVVTGQQGYIKLRVMPSGDYQFKNDWKADPKNTKACTLKTGDQIKIVMIPQVYISEKKDDKGKPEQAAGLCFQYLEITKVKTVPASKKKKEQ